MINEGLSIVKPSAWVEKKCNMKVVCSCCRNAVLPDIHVYGVGFCCKSCCPMLEICTKKKVVAREPVVEMKF